MLPFRKSRARTSHGGFVVVVQHDRIRFFRSFLLFLHASCHNTLRLRLRSVRECSASAVGRGDVIALRRRSRRYVPMRLRWPLFCPRLCVNLRSDILFRDDGLRLRLGKRLRRGLDLWFGLCLHLWLYRSLIFWRGLFWALWLRFRRSRQNKFRFDVLDCWSNCTYVIEYIIVTYVGDIKQFLNFRVT